MSRNDRYGWLGLLWRAVSVGLWAGILMALLTLVLTARVQAADTHQGLALYDGRGELAGYAPRLGTEVSIRVTGILARVTVRQRFHNPGENWLEGIYVFPLPENAAVDRLRMSYAGREVEGEIRERQQARRIYERARASGQGASLLNQQRANILTTSVANIPPNETVRVEIEYQQQLQWRAGEFSLRFPLVVGPRYIPGAPLTGEGDAFAGEGWARNTDQVPDASQITPPVVLQTDEGFNPVSIEVELNAGLKLAGISSPYHPIDVRESAPGSYRVALAEGRVPANRDFVLCWRPVLTERPTAALLSELWRGRHYGLLMVMPPQPQSLPEPVARELVLVVDTSGSMHGDSIAQAREALLSALQQLKPGDRFNIIQFNSGLDALFDGAVPAEPGYLEQARRYVRALRADGGTEMLPAMRLALDDPSPSGLLRQVVFLTDGAVGNEQALFEAVLQGVGDSRLFIIGIGSAPNALFMRRAAGFGRGTFTYIGKTQEVQHKVESLFRQISAPVLTDVRLHWQMAAEAGPVTQAPQVVPDLYAGEPIVVALEADSAPLAVRIEGRFGGARWQQALGLQDGAASEAVHALWARRMIEDWMARLVTGEGQDRVRDAVLALALEHRLVSRYTSLVAVDRAPLRPPSGGLRSVAMPTHLPAGWSASAVFGRLPGTATPAPMFLLLGLALLALAWIGARRWI